MKRILDAKLVADRLASLSEPIRLRVLRILEREELSVGEVARVVQLPQSTVSRHLKVLTDAGWLLKRAEGTATLYRLVLDDLPMDVRALWVAVRDQLGPGDADTTEDHRRLAAVIEERRLDSQAFFGRIAGQWDDVRADLFGQRFMAAAMLALLPREWTVADLGCGTGNASELLAPMVREVIAVDQSPAMLQAAKKRLAGHANISFVEGTLEALPLSDGAVDAAVCVLVLHHLAEPAKAIAGARRVLRPGGVLLIVDMIEHDREEYRHTMGHRWLGFSSGVVSEWLVAAGFDGDSPSYQTLPPDPHGRGPGLFVATGRVSR